LTVADGTKHRIEIEFCLVCKFQGRALWMARELIDQRPDLADEFVLVPSSNGAFTVRYDGEVVFDYREHGRFPEPKEVREAILAASGRPPTPKRH
jgi:selenoprotein W-related protein